MRRLLVFQHVSFEILGTLHPLLKARGFRLRYANFGRHPHAHPDVTRYNGLVVLGGPMNVDELARHPHLDQEFAIVGRASGDWSAVAEGDVIERVNVIP